MPAPSLSQTNHSKDPARSSAPCFKSRPLETKNRAFQVVSCGRCELHLCIRKDRLLPSQVQICDRHLGPTTPEVPAFLCCRELGAQACKNQHGAHKGIPCSADGAEHPQSCLTSPQQRISPSLSLSGSHRIMPASGFPHATSKQLRSPRCPEVLHW